MDGAEGGRYAHGWEGGIIVASYPILRGISECAGVGGIDLAFKLLFGEQYRTVCYIEREAGCASTLVARMADATLDQAPVWDDMRTFPAERFRGVANIVYGGIPCQPWSAAGRGLGDADPRHLWPAMLGHIRAIEPEWVFIENVPGLLRAGGYEVIKAELEAVGYRVEAGIFSAAEVGASHLRERLFILAHGEKSRGRRVSAQQRRAEVDNPNGQGCDVAHGEGGGLGELRQSPGGDGLADGRDEPMGDTEGGKDHERRPGSMDGAQRGRGSRDNAAGIAGNDVADSQDADGRAGGERVEIGERIRRRGPRRLGADVGNAEESRLQGWSGAGVDTYELPPFPPGPAERDKWAAVLAIDPSLEPAICGVADGSSQGLGFSRTDQLRELGNSVVPLTAAFAFASLLMKFYRYDQHIEHIIAEHQNAESTEAAG